LTSSRTSLKQTLNCLKLLATSHPLSHPFSSQQPTNQELLEKKKRIDEEDNARPSALRKGTHPEKAGPHHVQTKEKEQAQKLPQQVSHHQRPYDGTARTGRARPANTRPTPKP